MRIVVNDIAASEGGALTVLKNFYDAVNAFPDDHEWIFLLGDHYIEETERVKVKVFPQVKASRMKRLAFDLHFGKKIIEELRPDVVFSLQNTACFGLHIPQVLFVHQSLPFQRGKKFSFLKRQERPLAVIQYLIGTVIKRSVRHVDKVIVQTNWMRDEILKRCRVCEDRVVAILPTVATFTNTKGVQFDSKKFFYPTSTEIYKNIICIEQAVKMLEEKSIDCEVELTTEDTYSSPHIHGDGRLTHEDVIQKYFESTLLFPSYIETFGYPLAEARNANDIVLASDCSFSREVLANYPNAYFFSYNKPEELAALMEKVIRGEIIKSECCSEAKQTNAWFEAICEILHTGKV